MSIANIASKIYRRAEFSPLTRRPTQHAKDWVDTILFWTKRSQRLSQAQRLKECSTIEDYYSVAVDFFDPHQLREEITRFLQLAREVNPQCVCEIGTASGGTNFLLTHALPEVSLMMGLDLFVRNKAQLQYFARPGQELHFLDGSSYSDSTVERARQVLAGRQLDVLFIDGDHSYRGVRDDFLQYRHFVREGGLIAFHDIAPDHLTRYGRPTGRYAGEVPLFWDKIKNFYSSQEIIESPDQDGLGIGVIRYTKETPLPADL